MFCFVFFFQAEDGIRDGRVTGVQTCALPISPALVALGATARIAAGSRERTVPMEKFFVTPRENVLRENVLLANEILTAIDGVVADARIVLGGVAPIPYRAVKAEAALVGKPLNEANATAAGVAAVD